MNVLRRAIKIGRVDSASAREVLCWIALFAGACCSPALAAVSPNATNPEAVQQVVDGQRTEANAAWWGFNKDDSTAFLQAAIDSGARKVTVPYMGEPWIITPVKLRSGLELVFEPGVVVLAKEGMFKGKGDSLFTAVNAHDIAIRGYGATLRMRKKDYQSEAYEKAEWRMTLDFAGCRNVCVEGVRLESSGGDGIYLGCTEELPYCADVVIRDVVCDGHHRQGISVIGAENLLIENCILSNTKGTAPQAGIDFEPNAPRERLVNCVVRNCIMEGNAGAGVLVYLRPLTRESQPVSILVENCHIRSGDDCGVAVGAIGDNGPKGSVTFRNCTIENTKKSGAYVYDKSVDSALVRFENCRWRNAWREGTSYEKSSHVPILLHVRRPEITERFGGIEFVDSHVFDDKERPAVLLDENNRERGLSEVSGALFVHNPHGARADFGANATNVSLDLVQAE